MPVIKEMLFTARPMPADRALRVGLIDQVVPAERLESATAELARHMIRNSPLVISLLKEQLRVLAEAHPLNPRRVPADLGNTAPDLGQRGLPAGYSVVL